MRIDSLWIGSWKNLRNFSVDFDETTLTTVVVGRNGTGKSNLLEAIVIIFRDLDLDDATPFAYKIVYRCRDREISIDADPQRRDRLQIQIKEKDTSEFKSISRTDFLRPDDNGRSPYLPAHVFGYYSGLSNRMEELFEKHQERFYEDLIHDKDRPLRPLFYARLVHSQFVLLAFFSQQDAGTMDFLRRHLKITELDSILFVLHQPPWGSNEGDERFWRARGAVATLLARLYQLSLAPLPIKRRIRTDFRKNSTREFLCLYLQSPEDFEKLADHYETQQEFFKALESTYISELIEEVRIRVRLELEDGSLTFRELSEGEQQLLMVLGLLRFTREEESLFLLDEPDTHLNPLWSIQYLEMLREIVGEDNSSHIILTSHNPLVLTGLKREQVQIISRYEHRTENGIETYLRVEQPLENPNEMDVESILTNEAFGLRSVVGVEAAEAIEERRALADKEGRLTSEEKARLLKLNEQLEALEWRFIHDPLRPIYEQFFAELQRKEEPSPDGDLDFTPQQIETQRRLAAEIFGRLKNETSSEENS